MSEFLGARISLVSRSDIRYVGTLHEINSEASTVALENVSSYGTEGRKSDPADEIPPSDSVYEYIVFRGSDVKDLRIEEAPAPTPTPEPPKVPNDPAILGGTRPVPQGQAPQGPARQTLNQQQGAPQGSQHQGPPHGPQSGPQGGPPFAQHHQFPPPFYPPPPAGWGRAPPGPGGYSGMPPFGGPPGWYPPPGQGFPQPPNFPYGYPPGPPGQGQQYPPGQGQQQQSKPAPIGPGANKLTSSPPAQVPLNDKQAEPKSLAKPAEMPAAAVEAPTASKSSPAAVQAAVSKPPVAPSTSTTPATKLAPGGAKNNNNRIQPAVPFKSPAPVAAPLANITNAPATQENSLKDATAAATAAVAAAMAKLPPAGAQSNGNAVDNLTRKVNEMRVNEPVRAPRQPTGAGGFTGRVPRGGRGGRRGGGAAPEAEVPAEDFDFEESNAKFNKQDLVKEAIAGSPLDGIAPEQSPEPEVPVTGYNKASSFFDNISSESKDRAEAGSNRPGGREWRGEEQKKNVETFGQGSVDNNYRGGYRGRGRGRGYRGRGHSNNGQTGRGRGAYRGSQGAQTTV